MRPIERKHRVIWTTALVLAVLLVGCRGTISPNPPIHISPNMDNQPRFDPQAANNFFADGRAMRLPVPGTIARGYLREDAAFFYGRLPDGSFVSTMPLPATRELLVRGQERYDIFCAPCHGKAGDGQGIIVTGNYGYVPAPSYHTDALRAQSDGYFYDSLTHGVRSMPGYGTQIPVADRWAIVAYIRALQRSQHAEQSDIPTGVVAQTP